MSSIDGEKDKCACCGKTINNNSYYQHEYGRIFCSPECLLKVGFYGHWKKINLSDLIKKEFVGTITIDNDIWGFETGEKLYSANVPTAIDELLETETENGEKYKITIEKI